MAFSLNIKEEFHPKFIILFKITVSIGIGYCIFPLIGFIMTLCITNYNVKDIKETLTILNSFSFTDGHDFDTSRGTLGKFGDDTFECYIGMCHYYHIYTTNDCDYWTGMCLPDSEIIEDGSSESPLICSEKCRNNMATNQCNECEDNRKNSNQEFTFSCEQHSELTSKRGSCIQKNVINFWKGLYYTNKTINDYNVLNIAISGEECPEGTKKCGKLDEHNENYICYENKDECPVNLITKNENEIKQYSNYITVSFLDGTKIFYTNKAIETGVVVRDIFFDINFDSNNNDCKIIDSTTMGVIINDNDLDSKNNIHADKQAFLISCNPLTGKDKNITALKQIQAEAEKNKTINKEIISPVKSLNIGGYILSMVGLIILVFMLFLIYSAFNITNNKSREVMCINCTNCLIGKLYCFLIMFLITFAMIIGGILLLIFNIDELKELPDKLGFNYNICKANFIFDFIFFVGFIIFIIPFTIFMMFICNNNNKINY